MANERAEWYYVGDSGQIGPLTESQLIDLAEHSVLGPETMVWKVGMSGWVAADSVPKIAASLRPQWSPPPIDTPPSVPGSPASQQRSVQCPRDGTQLRHDVKSGVEIDWCPTCRGVWLDRGELEKLMERESRTYDDGYRGDERYRGKRKKRGLLGEVFDIFD